MKVLYITERFPYPLDTGGKIRSFHILKGLSQTHQVTFLSNFTPNRDEQYFHNIERFVDSFFVVPKPLEGILELGLKVITSLFSNTPIVVSRHYNPLMSQKILHLMKEHFDLVHFDQLDTTIYMKDIKPNIDLYLDQHNVVTNQIKTSYLVEPRLLKKIYMKFQINRTLSYESKVCEQMDLCLVCSEADKEHLKAIAPKSNLKVIPNGADVDFFSTPITTRPSCLNKIDTSKLLIFVGTLDYGPGETAVQYFCNDVLPLLRKEQPELCFIAVGQNPPKFLTQLSKEDSRIIVTGRVDDIRPYVANSAIFVVPLLSGSGTRLKILDAMSMKIPIVSTSIGAEGLDINPHNNIMIADNPTDFCHSVLELINSKDLQEKLIKNGYDLVKKKYSWAFVWELLYKVYK